LEVHGQLGGELIEGKPWNSSRLAKITTYIAKKANQNIFSLSTEALTKKLMKKSSLNLRKPTALKEISSSPRLHLRIGSTNENKIKSIFPRRWRG
jgi:hypothetical protein